MGKHQNDSNANELWVYFQFVIAWVKALFPTYRKEMKGIDWGTLYNQYHDNDYDPEDGWTEEDIELHKSIDWKARNYEEYDAGDSVTMEVVLYGLDEPEYAKVEMHKFLIFVHHLIKKFRHKYQIYYKYFLFLGY